MAEKKRKKDAVQEQSKEEQIGFHKGSLSVLAKEREELARILAIVEQLMQLHLTQLRELGVNLEQEAEKLMGSQAAVVSGAAKGPSKPKKKPPIEDII